MFSSDSDQDYNGVMREIIVNEKITKVNEHQIKHEVREMKVR